MKNLLVWIFKFPTFKTNDDKLSIFRVYNKLLKVCILRDILKPSTGMIMESNRLKPQHLENHEISIQLFQKNKSVR